MSRRGRGAAAATLLLLVGTALAGCGGGDDSGTPEVTLPSSLSIPTTEQAPSTSVPSSSTTTTGVPPTNPRSDGSPVIVSVAVEPGACVADASTATVTFEMGPQPPVRVFSVHLDGSRDAAASSATATPIVVPAVPCDGAIHTVLFIAFGTDGRSSTQAVAFRAPLP